MFAFMKVDFLRALKSKAMYDNKQQIYIYRKG